MSGENGVENEDDLFADLYDGEADDPQPVTTASAAAPGPEPVPAQPEPIAKEEPEYQQDANLTTEAPSGQGEESMQDVKNDFGSVQQSGNSYHDDDNERPIGMKEDGKMFIGGLNWETTDESLKNYFSQFGEVVECTVMRDGATGRSRGFGFLTFRDPKTVNTVMVKEHMLDDKIIDPKRAIPREEQERTAKIFVGGVSQEATEQDFKTFFDQFGRVLDATLMMDKNTGRPRGFGFVTFDSEAAVDRTLEQPLAIHGKMIEVKRAQPRGAIRDEEDDGGRGKFGRHNRGGGGGGSVGGGGGGGGNNFNDFNQQNQGAQQGQGNNMSQAMMAQYWQRMQQYFQMMQQQMMTGGGMNPAMMQNPQMMQQMMAMGRGGGGGQMNPQMMQQMAAMQGYPVMNQGGGGGGGGGGSSDGGSPLNGGPSGGPRPGFNAQDQLMFEQQKYERQQMARMQGNNFNGSNTWEGMYDDVPAPAGMAGGNGGRGGGGFNNRGGRGGGGGGMRHGSQGPSGSVPPQAPANAPTGPKNAGKPGANYRGGGRGGHRGFHPYAQGGRG